MPRSGSGASSEPAVRPRAVCPVGSPGGERPKVKSSPALAPIRTERRAGSEVPGTLGGFRTEGRLDERVLHAVVLELEDVTAPLIEHPLERGALLGRDAPIGLRRALG